MGYFSILVIVMVNRPWTKEQKHLQVLLKKIRVEAKLTQKELAQKLNKPQSYISKYESGERRLDYLEIREILASCDTSIYVFEDRFKTIGGQGAGLI